MDAPDGQRAARTVVVGYIPSPEGIAALAAAKDEVLRHGGTLHVVNTGDHGDFSGANFATGRDLDALEQELQEAGVSFSLNQPTGGRGAAEELVLAAETTGADLVVIGLRRRSPIGKLFLGSTAQQVLLDAPCAVLAVKGR